MQIETKIQLERRLKNDARQHTKDRIIERMEKKLQQFQNKNKTINTKDKSDFHTTGQQKYTNHQDHVFDNNIKVTNISQHFNNTKIEEIDDF